MKTFLKWLEEKTGIDEKKMRTCLALYPPAYGRANYPPLNFTPISASAAWWISSVHGVDCKGKGKCDIADNTEKKPKKDKAKKSKK